MVFSEELKGRLEWAYQGLKIKCDTREELQQMIDKFTPGFPKDELDVDAIKSIRKELSKMLKKDKDFK